MLIHYDPDEYETVVDRHVCSWHRVHPGETYAGCTCSMGISSVRRPAEQIAKIKADRRCKEEDTILAQAEIIKARRSSQDTK